MSVIIKDDLWFRLECICSGAHAVNKLLLEPFGEVRQQLNWSVHQVADNMHGGVSQGQTNVRALQKVLQLGQQLIHLTGVEVGRISGQIEQHVGLAVSCNHRYLKQASQKTSGALKTHAHDATLTWFCGWFRSVSSCGDYCSWRVISSSRAGRGGNGGILRFSSGVLWEWCCICRSNGGVGLCNVQIWTGCGRRWYRVIALFVQLYDQDSSVLTGKI